MELKPTLLRLTAALVAIIAIAAVAASLPIAVDTPGDGGDGEGSAPSVGHSESDSGDTGPPLIIRVLVLMVPFLMVITLLIIFYYDRRKLLELYIPLFVIIMVVVVFIYIVQQTTEITNQVTMNASSPGSSDGTPVPEPGTGESSESMNTPLLTTTEMLEIAIGLLVLGIAGLGLRKYLRRGESSGNGIGDTQADIGAAAGAAADRIENRDDPSVENAVYDAWFKMTRYLPVDDPDTSTPGEFAAAAAEAGIDSRDVEKLTSLFESVRYGPKAATPVTERRAVEILRRIESTYDESDATEESVTADPGSGSDPIERDGL